MFCSTSGNGLEDKDALWHLKFKSQQVWVYSVIQIPVFHSLFRLISFYDHNTSHNDEMTNEQDWQHMQLKGTQSNFSKESVLKENCFLLFCVTLVEKAALVMPPSGLCSLAFLVHTHTSYVVLHFQSSLGKLTPVANSFSPLLYSTYIRGTTGPSVLYGNACWKVVKHPHFELAGFPQSLGTLCLSHTFNTHVPELYVLVKYSTLVFLYILYFCIEHSCIITSIVLFYQFSALGEESPFTWLGLRWKLCNERSLYIFIKMWDSWCVSLRWSIKICKQQNLVYCKHTGRCKFLHISPVCHWTRLCRGGFTALSLRLWNEHNDIYCILVINCKWSSITKWLQKDTDVACKSKTAYWR